MMFQPLPTPVSPPSTPLQVFTAGLGLLLQLLNAAQSHTSPKEHWDGYVFLTIIYRQWRRNRYLKEALRRERRENIAKLNQLWQKLLTIFTNAPPPKLEDLIKLTDRDFTLK